MVDNLIGQEEEVLDDIKVEDVNDDKEDVKTKKVIVKEFERLNEQKPIWIRKSEDVTEEEYKAFYKNVSNDHGDYSKVKHFSVEGNLVFSSILFIPKNKPFDMFGGGNDAKLHNKIKLYVRRVFILDKCEQLMPEYLHFVAGIVDSDDLSLNISREILQKNNTIKKIRKTLVKKAIKMMEDLSQDEENYAKFYKEFHKNIKWGINDDEPNREKLSKLVRYYTTTSGESQTSLTQYVENMKEDQKHIYYISGESTEMIKKSDSLF